MTETFSQAVHAIWTTTRVDLNASNKMTRSRSVFVKASIRLSKSKAIAGLVLLLALMMGFQPQIIIASSDREDEYCEPVLRCRNSLSCLSYRLDKRDCTGHEAHEVIRYNRDGTSDCKQTCYNEAATQLVKCKSLIEHQRFPRLRHVRCDGDASPCYKYQRCRDKRRSPPVCFTSFCSIFKAVHVSCMPYTCARTYTYIYVSSLLSILACVHVFMYIYICMYISIATHCRQ